MPSQISTTDSCPSTDTLHRCVNGQLHEAELESTIEHIDRCLKCQQRVETLDTDANPPLQRLKSCRIESDDETIMRLLSLRRDQNANRLVVPPIPQRIGPYVVIRRIAAGGMGTIYEGRHVNLGRSVAIKWLNGETTLSRRRAEQVLREWRAHGRLMHPNIVVATDAGLVDGWPYLITELIDGLDLSKLIKSSGPLSVEKSAKICHDVAVAMAYAHGAGVAHLDIKPSNIMLDRNGVVKLLDLGTAQTRNLDRSPAGSKPNTFQDQFGTLGFLAPERIEASRDASQIQIEQQYAADIYSLGCTLQYLLTARAPFGNLTGSSTDTGQMMEIISAHQHQEPPRIEFADPGVNRSQQTAIQALVDSMLAKEPGQRPSSMAEVSSSLRKLAFPNTELSDNAKRDLAKLVTSASQENQESVASGVTIGLTDLIRTNHRKKRSRTFVAVGIVSALIAATMAALLVYQVSNRTTAKHTSPDINVLRDSEIDATESLSSDQQALTSGTGSSSDRLSDIQVGLGIVETDTDNETTSDYPPLVTRRSPYGYMVMGSEYHHLLKFAPQTNTEYCSQSEPLLRRLQKFDPTIKHAAVTTVAPHDETIQLRWSPDGKRLAVLTARNRIRVYDWNGESLSLIYTMRGDRPSQWARTISWHPTNGSLLAASYNFVGEIRFAGQQRTVVYVHPVSFEGIESIKTISDQGKTLILVGTNDRVHCYDPEIHDVIDHFSKTDVLKYDAGVDGPDCLILTTERIEWWQASYSALDPSTADENSVNSNSANRNTANRNTGVKASDPTPSRWSLRLLESHKIDDASSIRDIRLTDRAHYVLRRKKQYAFHALQGGENVARISAGKTECRNFEALPRGYEGGFAVLQGLIHQVELRRTSTNPLSDKCLTSDTRAPGDRLLYPCTAFNPTNQNLAVFWRGHAEVWNSQLETISVLPRCDAYIDVDSAPLRSGFLIFRHDGSGIAVGGDGRFASGPVPRVPLQTRSLGEIRNSRFCEPNSKLIQEVEYAEQDLLRDVPWHVDAGNERSPQSLRADNPSYAISIMRNSMFNRLGGSANDSRSADDWRHCCVSKIDRNNELIRYFVPLNTGQPARISVARDRALLCNSDASGRVSLFDLSKSKSKLHNQLQIRGVGKYPSVRISHDGKSIYVASDFNDGVEIKSINALTGSEIWKVKTAQLFGLTQLTLDSSGHLIVTNERKWVRLDPATGKEKGSIDPRERYGFRHKHSLQNPYDQGILSWTRSAHIYPAAVWNSKAELQAMVFATEPDSWLSISPDGDVIDSVQGGHIVDRFVRKEGQSYEPAAWAFGKSPRIYRPEQSLTVVCTHENDRCTFIPIGESLQAQRASE